MCRRVLEREAALYADHRAAAAPRAQGGRDGADVAAPHVPCSSSKHVPGEHVDPTQAAP